MTTCPYRHSPQIAGIAGRETGAAAVEFALVAVPLIALLAGVIDFGYSSTEKSGVNNAAYVAVRQFTKPSQNLTSTQAQAAATSALQSALPRNYTSYSVTYSIVGGASGASAKCPDAVSATTVSIAKVSLTATYPSLTKLIKPSYTMTSTATAVCS